MPVINLQERKRGLRARFKRYRAECPPALKQLLDQQLFERVRALGEYRDADILFAYISQPIECDTSAIIKDALKKGKRVAVPRCRADSHEMDFYFIQSYDELSTGKYGLLEPVPQLSKKATDFSHGLCLVPGLSFDLQGYRLGFGKGYYDRFLSRFGGVTVGICYSKCMLGEVPRGAYDRAVDIVIPEKFCSRTGC